MKRDAIVALTEPGATNVNRLRAPQLRVVSLFVKKSQQSKTYLPADVPAPAAAGSDDFHFAPGYESVAIHYEIDDFADAIEKAELQLYTRFKEAPLWTLDLTKLGRDWFCHGTHEIEWDGRLPGPPNAEKSGEKTGTGYKHKLSDYPPKEVKDVHPDGYVTVEHSPYKLRLLISSSAAAGNPVTAWTYFQILVKEIKLELGDKKTLPAKTGTRDLDLEVYEDDDAEALKGSLPAEGGRKKLFLTSDVFSMSCAEQFNKTDFTQYETLWGDGPKVPIVAHIKIRDSADKAVDAPKALGNVRTLWDVEFVGEAKGSEHGNHHAKAKAFLEAAAKYHKDGTDPKGDTCHKDRGGKRGDTAKFYFPEQKGYDPQDALKDRAFPFKVAAWSVRKWAAYSLPWTRGALAGKTGVLFQPSRTAGDGYKVTAYLAYDKTAVDKWELDKKDDAPLKLNADIKKSTGTFELWRRVHFRKYLKKKAGVTPNFPVATFQGYYKRAYMQMKDVTGGAGTMTKADYDAKVQAAITAAKGTHGDYYEFLFATGSQFDAGLHAIDFRDYNTFKTDYKTHKGWTDAQLTSFLGTVLNTKAKYNKYCGNIATSVLTEVGKAYMHADDGVNLFHFNEHYNLATDVGGETLNGFAPGTPIARTRCMFVLCAGPNNYTGTNNKAEQTVAHEIGHCLFLAHSKDGVSATDACNKPDEPAHDDAWSNCTMSYNYTAERKFCGLCLLRLRGWNRDALDKTAANNTKP